MSDAKIQGEVSALLVLSSTTLPGTDQEAFNKWYNEVHVPDILTAAKFTSCRRYRVSSARLFSGILQEPDYEYAAVYQVTAKSDADLEAAVEQLNQLAAKGISSNENFDNSRTTATFLLPISDEIIKDPNYQHSGTDGS